MGDNQKALQRQIAFTEAELKKLPFAPEGTRTTYHDAGETGLQLRVSSGAKVFYVFARPRGGRPERIKIGRWPSVTVKKAVAKAREIVGTLATANSPAEARRLLKSELTLGELFELYAKDRQRAGKRSIGDLRALWELYLGKMPDAPRKKHGAQRAKAPAGIDWSQRRLSHITTQAISTLHARIVDAGHPTTANRVHELLRAMFGFAVRQKSATENPADGITQAKENERHRHLGRDELPLFIEALKQEPQHWRDYFTVLLYVGYRKRAVCAMRWQDVDLDSGYWAVPGERAKNGEPIVLPLAGPALTTLKRRFREREAGPWVFPGRSKAGYMTQPKKAWKRLLSRAGVTNFRIHDLRHTLGAWLASTGASLPAIGRALGHKDPRSAQVYAHLQAEAVTSTVATAHKAMRAALADPKVIPMRRARQHV
jgi:integrase